MDLNTLTLVIKNLQPDAEFSVWDMTGRPNTDYMGERNPLKVDSLWISWNTNNELPAPSLDEVYAVRIETLVSDAVSAEEVTALDNAKELINALDGVSTEVKAVINTLLDKSSEQRGVISTRVLTHRRL